MDNSISDDNINTVAAAAVVAASTATAAVDTQTITKSNDGSQNLSCHDDYGQTIGHIDDNGKTKYGDKSYSVIGSSDGCTATTATNTEPEPRTKDLALRRNDGSSYKRTITSKCISRARDLVHKCQSDPGGSRVLPAPNVITNRSSQDRSSFRQHSPSCSSTPPSSTATTTRKCVLTLDGYNYVIGKLNHKKKKTTNMNLFECIQCLCLSNQTVEHFIRKGSEREKYDKIKSTTCFKRQRVKKTPTNWWIEQITCSVLTALISSIENANFTFAGVWFVFFSLYLSLPFSLPFIWNDYVPFFSFLSSNGFSKMDFFYSRWMMNRKSGSLEMFQNESFPT